MNMLARGSGTWVVAVCVSTGLLVAACTGGGDGQTNNPSPGQRLSGGDATMAMPPSNSPDYIFPVDDSSHTTTADIQMLQYLLWRPLYWFGTGSSPTINYKLSLAQPPTFSDGGRTVTIRLNKYEWSDGKPVTSRDVAFWQRLVMANQDNYGGSVPGAYPDNVTSFQTPNASTIVMHFNKAYDERWLLYNELSQITPLPTHVWDKTSDSGPIGKADLTVHGAIAVYNYLAGQSRDLGTYTSNPLWQVVDGPWKLSQFSASTGTLSFVPNKGYSGPVKPTLSRFTELGFTSDEAELNAVASGSVDLGYLPFSSLPQQSRFASQGYRVVDWPGWDVRWFDPNYNNPKTGPIFRQLYVRQALEHVMDEQGVIKAVYDGRAKPSFGPVPNSIPNPFISSYAKTNPYPFSTNTAKSLLTSHGWVLQNGVAVCSKAGVGAGQCGAGISVGTPLKLDLIYVSGEADIQQSMSIYKSNAAKAGIDIQLSSEPFGSVVGSHGKCTAGAANCNWDMINWGGGWGYEPDYYPTGELLFATGAGSNRSNYSNTQNDANIKATELAGSGSPTEKLTTYQNYLIKQAAAIWEPTPPLQVSLIKSTLQGVTPQNPTENITPEQWYFTGSK